jgi:ppGpp synthetase/RelA/SpoT-type nucleotidyltranferase
LLAIGIDHETKTAHLEEAAALVANVIQRFTKVHSVRWRVKDTEHLLAKIVRKRAECSGKYDGISTENYADVVTDLIGIRALHLFKADFLDIDKYIQSCLELRERPVAYVRSGDDQVLSVRYEEAGFEVKDHPKGYRSIHYVATTQPLKQRIHVEIQVRTIFEEGWSEIDHTLRYPNFSDNMQVEYLLTILNRMAGSADELGGFAKVLADVLSRHEMDLQQAKVARDESFAKMEEALAQLAASKTDQASSDRVVEVKRELEKLKIEPSRSIETAARAKVLKWIAENGISGSIASGLAGQLDSSNSTLELAKKLNGSATLELAKKLNGSTTLELAKKLNGSNTALELAKQLNGSDAARELAKKLNGSNAALELARQLNGSSAALELAKHLHDPADIRELKKKFDDPTGSR